MVAPKKSSERQRRVWRITSDAPHGEVVDPDRPPKPEPASSASDDGSDGGWLRSSWDLLHGVEVTETDPGERFEELFEAPPAPASTSAPQPGPTAVSKHQWILRFALKYAELDPRAEPKQVLALARQLSPAWDQLAPEDAARKAHDEADQTGRNGR